MKRSFPQYPRKESIALKELQVSQLLALFMTSVVSIQEPPLYLKRSLPQYPRHESLALREAQVLLENSGSL